MTRRPGEWTEVEDERVNFRREHYGGENLESRPTRVETPEELRDTSTGGGVKRDGQEMSSRKCGVTRVFSGPL